MCFFNDLKQLYLNLSIEISSNKFLNTLNLKNLRFVAVAAAAAKEGRLQGRERKKSLTDGTILYLEFEIGKRHLALVFGYDRSRVYFTWNLT